MSPVGIGAFGNVANTASASGGPPRSPSQARHTQCLEKFNCVILRLETMFSRLLSLIVVIAAFCLLAVKAEQNLRKEDYLIRP